MGDHSGLRSGTTGSPPRTIGEHVKRYRQPKAVVIRPRPLWGQVRSGLTAGERWIRSIGSPPELNIRMEPGGGEARIQANARTFLPGAPEFTGETDSPLEGAGFELSIPRQS
jgi:hypothetical protein